MKGMKKMILRSKIMKVIELLRYFRKLRDIDKLRIFNDLLENKYLHIDIDKDKQISKILQKY